MITGKKIASGAGKFVKGLDILVGNLPGIGLLFSRYAKVVDPEETISSKLGKEQLRRLCLEWDGKDKDYYPFIPLSHPFGQPAIIMCECAQRYHGLLSISFDKGYDILKDFPNGRQVRYAYLKMNGITMK